MYFVVENNNLVIRLKTQKLGQCIFLSCVRSLYFPFRFSQFTPPIVSSFHTPPWCSPLSSFASPVGISTLRDVAANAGWARGLTSQRAEIEGLVGRRGGDIGHHTHLVLGWDVVWIVAASSFSCCKGDRGRISPGFFYRWCLTVAVSMKKNNQWDGSHIKNQLTHFHHWKDRRTKPKAPLAAQQWQQRHHLKRQKTLYYY